MSEEKTSLKFYLSVTKWLKQLEWLCLVLIAFLSVLIVGNFILMRYSLIERIGQLPIAFLVSPFFILAVASVSIVFYILITVVRYSTYGKLKRLCQEELRKYREETAFETDPKLISKIVEYAQPIWAPKREYFLANFPIALVIGMSCYKLLEIRGVF